MSIQLADIIYKVKGLYKWEERNSYVKVEMELDDDRIRNIEYSHDIPMEIDVFTSNWPTGTLNFSLGSRIKVIFAYEDIAYYDKDGFLNRHFQLIKYQVLTPV